MKRKALALAVCIVLSLCGCGTPGGTPPATENRATDSAATQAVSPSPAATAAAPTASARARPTPSAHVQYTGPGAWQLTGQIGGTAKALLREGGTLYIGVGLHVLILDARDPKEMKVVGSSPLLPQFVESIAGDGKGRLYVCCGSGGLVILDVSNPSSPVVSGKLDTRGYTEGVALCGKYAVLADGPHGVQVADVSNPEKPVPVSEAYSLAYAYDVAIKDNVAYVAAGGSGLLVVDLSDPKSPGEKGLTKLDGFQYDVEISGGQLYAAGAWGGVSVLSLAKPLEPALAGAVSTTGWAMALCVQDSDLLVMDGADGAALYDISGAQPALKSTYSKGGFVWAGTLNAKSAFLLDREKGLMTVDFSNASNPRLVSRWMPILDGRRVTMSGGAGYVAGGLSGMHVIDLGDRDNPVETSWYDTGGGYANKVIVDGNIAYLSTHLASDFPLVIFDVSDPLYPKRLGAVPNDEAVFNVCFRSLTLNGGYIYTPGEFHDGAVDVRDPRNPKVVNTIDMENPINAASYGNLLITTNSTQLQLVDISDPTNMKLISTLDKMTTGEAITFINPTTVITAADPGVWVVDVSDPYHPQKKAELALSGSVMDISIDGTLAYMASLGNGIQIVDISNPFKPTLKGSVATLGAAYDCCVKGDLMLVADSYAGLTIYQYKPVSKAENAPAAAASFQETPLPLLLSESAPAPAMPPDTTPDSAAPGNKTSCVVTSAKDSGPGTLREILQNLRENTTVTFDAAVFPPNRPAVIQLESPLPDINADYLTIDASNAGVILDGGKLTQGDGLALHSSHSKIMGLQVLHFPQDGIRVEGHKNQIGGNRNTGLGPVGQGNLISGNQRNGINVFGFDHLLIGNLVGTDASGTKSVPNHYGIFVSDLAYYVTIGGVSPGEGNLVSGNGFTNMDTWGDHTRIIGNIVGLDITGTKKVQASTAVNLTMESNARSTTVGGTTPQERNIISGVDTGIIFSDPNSYQNAVIGNYIGTDITGTRAIPNQTGLLIWTTGNNRVGGAAPGERNLISGNQTGIMLNGYGVTDNIILGNWLGVDAGGTNPLPNDTGIAMSMGQRHAVIGGYTPQEGNLISGGSISMRISNPGIEGNYIAGNTLLNASVAGVYLEDRSSGNFVQGNTFGKMAGYPVRVDFGRCNEIRANTFTGDPGQMILLVKKGNLELPAPAVKAAGSYSVSGTARANCRVEVYTIENGVIKSLGFADAGADGKFVFRCSRKLDGKKIVAVATDASGNTSAFSKPITAKAGGTKP